MRTLRRSIAAPGASLFADELRVFRNESRR
jgi:hypothetical protein